MNPELIAAIIARINGGQTREVIEAELVATGYSSELATAAYEQAVTEHKLSVPQSSEAQVLDLVVPAVSPTHQVGQLVGYLAMVRAGWYLLKNNLKLFGGTILGFIVGYIVIFVLIFGMGYALLSGSVVIAGVVYILLLVASIALFMLPTTALMRALLRREESMGFWAAYRSLLPRFVSLILLGIFVQLATTGGFMLLLIPGLILTIYLLFPFYVLADRNISGLTALYVSYRLVRGRWWSVLGRFLFAFIAVGIGTFGVALMAIVPIVVLWGGINLADAASSGGFFNNALIPLLIALLYVGVLALGVGWIVATLVSLYESLRDSLTQQIETLTPSNQFKWVMRGLMVVPFVALLALASVTIGAMNNSRTSLQEASVRQSLSSTRSAALIYFNQNNFSYEGVCDEVPTMASGVEVVCNDGAEAYALTATLNRETWCVDSEGYNGTLASSLGSRTACEF